MVIAAFIAMLYSFTLSYRADIKSVEVSPQAESTIDKIVLQHRALQKFASDHLVYKSGSRTVSFTKGEVLLSSLLDYLPYGFNKGQGESNYVSVIYCMDKDDLTKPMVCDDHHATAYLLTYGCIDARWRSLSGGKPNNELTEAIKTIVRSGTSFGYTVKTDANDPRNDTTVKSTMAIQGNMKKWVAIPQYIIDNDIGLGERSFSTMCSGNNDNCEYCLAYLTPFF